MTIFVGSTNPVKTNAVIQASSETWPDVQVHGFDVPSGVSEQPMTDQETMQGAINRAKKALQEGLQQTDTTGQVLGVGLEGGVFQDEQGDLWSTVWCSVQDQAGNHFETNGARTKIPPIIAQPIINGEEMGPLMEKLANEPDIRQKQGMIGIVTNGFVDRTEEYMAIAKFALGLWHGKDWVKKLNK